MQKNIALLIILALSVTACSKKNVGPPPPASPLVSTFAGSGTPGNSDGPGASASFSEPEGMAIDAAGNVYVADLGNNMIRKISPNGVVSTLAGSGAQGAANGQGTAASFCEPGGVAVDAAGNVYVADAVNNMIRKITPAGLVSTIAGNGDTGAADGAGAAATFNYPMDVAVDAAGNVYVADYGNNLIRMVNPGGVVTTIAGATGTATAGYFFAPTSIAVGPAGKLFVADFYQVQDINTNGTVANLAYLNYPAGVTVYPAGNVYAVNAANNLVCEVDYNGVVTTIAGSGATGAANGALLSASFNRPWGVVADAAGNLYVSDSGNNIIRKIVMN